MQSSPLVLFRWPSTMGLSLLAFQEWKQILLVMHISLPSSSVPLESSLSKCKTSNSQLISLIPWMPTRDSLWLPTMWWSTLVTLTLASLVTLVLKSSTSSPLSSPALSGTLSFRKPLLLCKILQFPLSTKNQQPYPMIMPYPIYHSLYMSTPPRLLNLLEVY